jgi:ketosteroid isomerase-like protein
MMTVDDTTRDVIERFNDALNRHDIDGVMALMTPDCLFENTFPSPDGELFQGQQAVRGFWERLLDGAPQAHFTAEELFTAGDRGVVRWRYQWADGAGEPGHVRGVDLFRVRDGKVAEKLSYVKG